MAEVRLVQIADGVYVASKYLERAKISVNSFLVLDEEPAVFETGIAGMGRELAEAMRGIVDPKEIKHIFVTHEHLDHIGGLPELIASAYNASVYAHENASTQLAFMGVYGIVKPLRGGERIKLGRRTVEVFYAPIETHAYVYYVLMPDKIVFSGDYFGQLSPSGWTTYHPGGPDEVIRDVVSFHEGLGYSHEEVKKYLGRLKKLSPTLIAPSHGSMLNRNLEYVIPRVIEHKLKGGRKEALWAKIFGMLRGGRL